MLSVILNFVPRQHVLTLNKHGNVNKYPPKNIYFLIAGDEDKYFFGKSKRPWAHGPWAHELTSQTRGELMSWSPSVSAALQESHYIISLSLLTVTVALYYPVQPNMLHVWRVK